MSLWHDLHFSVRSLRHQPGLAITSVVILTLGIGANTALFTAVKAILLDPFPYKDPSRIVSLKEKNTHPAPLSPPDFFDWQRNARSFIEMAGYGWTSGNLSGDSAKLPEVVNGLYTSQNFFRTLGVPPALGRTFSAADDRPGAVRTIILSDALWRSRYAADPAIVGKTLDLDANTYTVIGVMPSTFTFGNSSNQYWILLRFGLSPQELTQRGDHCMRAIGRLKPGVSMQQAQVELSGIQARLQKEYGYNFGNSGASVTSLLDETVGSKVKTDLDVLWAAVGCVLLIACLNVANLLLTRNTSRQREMAIRTVLGATRRRIAWLLLLESLLLSAVGGAAGILLASWLTRLLGTLADVLPRSSGIEMDWTATLFAIGIALGSGLLAGLLPMFTTSKIDLNSALQEAGRMSTASRQRQYYRIALVAAELALSFVLLIGAGLLSKSFVLLQGVPQGFNPNHVLTMRFSLSSDYRDASQTAAFYAQLLERVKMLPGVQSAGLVSALPLQGHVMDTMFSIAGRPPVQGESNDALVRMASPDYFQTLSIPLIKGRFFSPAERLDRADKAIISASFAQHYFAGQNPVGQHISFMEDKPKEIVGVVGDVRANLEHTPEPTMYAPILSGDLPFVALAVRTSNDPLSLALPIQKQIAKLDPNLAVSAVLTYPQVIGRGLETQKLNLTLLLSFAGTALFLATVGLYGTLSYLATQRTPEFGIRLALGATPSILVREVLQQGLGPILTGLVGGLAGTYFAVRLIQSMLFAVQPFDPVVYIVVAAGLLCISVLACLFPALRTTKIDPAQVLRTE